MSSLPFAKKSLGQHWLTDLSVLTAMADAVAVGPRDTILEIGPGLGTLTRVLCQRAAHVVAVEFDSDLADALPGRVPAANLDVVSQDILRFDLTSLPADYKVAANIPYYLTSNLIRTLSESSNPPVCAALLVQKEVAERVTAGPGRMSLLSVTAQYYWQTRLAQEVPAHMFTPPPKVDSQILVLNRRTEPLSSGIDPRGYFRVVKAGFSQRRKTLSNSLSGGLQITKPEANILCERAGVDPSDRPQMLSLEQWASIYRAFIAS